MKSKKIIFLGVGVLLLLILAFTFKFWRANRFNQENDSYNNEDAASQSEELGLDDSEFDETPLVDSSANSIPFVANQNIDVFSPLPGDLVVSEDSLLVSGQARGSWFFEASFPVRLMDGNGKELATGIAQAEDDWMTEDFVPFSVELTVPKITTNTGSLVLVKDNPSGLPEHDDSLVIPLVFSN